MLGRSRLTVGVCCRCWGRSGGRVGALAVALGGHWCCGSRGAGGGACGWLAGLVVLGRICLGWVGRVCCGLRRGMGVSRSRSGWPGLGLGLRLGLGLGCGVDGGSAGVSGGVSVRWWVGVHVGSWWREAGSAPVAAGARTPVVSGGGAATGWMMKPREGRKGTGSGGGGERSWFRRGSDY